MTDRTKDYGTVRVHVDDAEKAALKGRYHNDYSPRYQAPFDIYEKAKAHMRKMKKEEQKA